MTRVWVCLLLWVVGFGLARAETLPALFDVTGVAADDVLNLRAAPDGVAEILGALGPSAKDVEVV
ncbi:MAG: peptide-binding protein, partial [Pseudorhodobacter sp.]